MKLKLLDKSNNYFLITKLQTAKYRLSQFMKND